MTQTEQQRSAPRVLIVEDDDAQRRVLADLIRAESFEPVVCASANEAISKAQRTTVAVAIVDQRLPDLSGTQLVAQLGAVCPGTKMIIHTGYGSFESARDAINRRVFAYVEKLDHPEVLIRHVHRAVQEWMAEALQKSQEDYRRLVDSVQAIVWRSHPHSLQYTFVSREAENVLGYPIDQWLTESLFWENHLHPDDRTRVVAHCEQAIRAGRSHECEYRMIAADSRVVWVRDIVTVIFENGEALELIGVTIDITEQKRTQDALRESEEKYRTLLEHLPIGVYRTTPEGCLLEANTAMADLFGVEDVDALRQRNVEELYVDVAQRKRHIEQLDTNAIRPAEYALRRADGKTIWVCDYPRAIRNLHSKVAYFDGVLVDITERKRAETEVQESEGRSKALLQAIPDMMFRFRQDGTFLDYKGPPEELAIPQDEIIGSQLADAPMPADVVQGLLHCLRTAIEQGEMQSLEYTLPLPAGLLTFEARFVRSGTDEAVCIVRNITQRRQAEQEIRLLAQALRSTRESVCITDPDYNILFVNEAFLDLYGYEKHDLIGRHITLVRSPDYSPEADPVRPAGAWEPWQGELWNRRKDGSDFLLSLSTSAVLDARGQPIAYIGVAQDVTEHKRAEMSLRESEARNKALVRAIPDTMFRINQDGLYLDFIPAEGFETLLPSEDFLGKSIDETLPLGLGVQTRQAIERALQTGQLQAFEYALESRYYEARLVPQEKDVVLAIIRDITERKKVEVALRESEERFSKVFHASPIAIAITRREDGRILELNESGERLFGYTRSQLVGRSASEMGLWPQRLGRERILSLLQEKGTLRDIKVQFQAASGALRDLEGALEQFELGGELCLLWMGLDVTERKHLEKEILEVSAREQRRIGQDLHDELGQLLTGIGFRVAELEGDLRRAAAPHVTDAAEIVQMIEKAIAQTRSLAQGLNPINVEQQGLDSALRELTLSVERIYGLRCTFSSTHPILINDQEVATHLYRIAQESINNVVKHARATYVEVTLTKENDVVTLTVRDDGIGLPSQNGPHQGMGLHIMAYRARMIDGVFSVHSGTPGGTIVTCSFNLGPIHQEAVQAWNHG